MIFSPSTIYSYILLLFLLLKKGNSVVRAAVKPERISALHSPLFSEPSLKIKPNLSVNNNYATESVRIGDNTVSPKYFIDP